MFKVKKFDNDEIVYTVYGTKESDFGVLLFLVFVSDNWIWMPADEYIPADFS